MCHHIASLISEAENSATDSARVLAQKEAQSAILSLWERRAALPGCAYPLARYKYLLRCLSAMSPDASIWEGHGSSSLDVLARSIFTNLTGITNIVLALKSRPPLFERQRQPVPSISVTFLDMLEKKVLSAAETLDNDTLSLLAKLDSASKEVHDPKRSSLTSLLKVVEAAQSNLTNLAIEVNKELSPATKEQPKQAEPVLADWQVAIVTELSPDALTECVEILRVGGAVRVSSARGGLLSASKVALAKSDGRIVGLAALKAKRPAYSSRIAGLSATSIGKDAVEVGYVAVRNEFRGRGLGSDLVSKLLAVYDGALFATTSSGAMKKVLRKERFRKTGKTWQGTSGRLSLWQRR